MVEGLSNNWSVLARDRKAVQISPSKLILDEIAASSL